MIKVNSKDIYRDFDVFTRALVVTDDVDPTYPIIRDVVKEFDFEPLWFVFVYVSIYSIESAIEICKYFPSADYYSEKIFRRIRNEMKLKFGYERRGCRSVENHVKLMNALPEFIKNMKQVDIKDNLTFQKKLRTLPQYGGWASYKTSEIFEKAFNFKKLEIKDLGIDHRDPNSDGDGAIPGLRILFGIENKYDESWKPIWNRFGENLAKSYNFNIGKIETSLCKFAKLVKGKYFVGHDIQEFVDLKNCLGDIVYKKIMKRNFYEIFWKNVNSLQKDWKRYYLETGDILFKEFAEQKNPVDIKKILLQTN